MKDTFGTVATFVFIAYTKTIDFVVAHPHWVFWAVVAYVFVRR